MSDHATVEAIEAAIADLRRRWPAHSVPPAMVVRLEALEDQLARVRDEGACA